MEWQKENQPKRSQERRRENMEEVRQLENTKLDGRFDPNLTVVVNVYINGLLDWLLSVCMKTKQNMTICGFFLSKR